MDRTYARLRGKGIHEQMPRSRGATPACQRQAGTGTAMPLRGARGAGAGAAVTSGGRPHRLSDEAPAAGRHHAAPLHRVGVAASRRQVLGQGDEGSCDSRAMRGSTRHRRKGGGVLYGCLHRTDTRRHPPVGHFPERSAIRASLRRRIDWRRKTRGNGLPCPRHPGNAHCNRHCNRRGSRPVAFELTRTRCRSGPHCPRSPWRQASLQVVVRASCSPFSGGLTGVVGTSAKACIKRSVSPVTLQLLSTDIRVR